MFLEKYDFIYHLLLVYHIIFFIHSANILKSQNLKISKYEYVIIVIFQVIL
jgi:hypothetical protein